MSGDLARSEVETFFKPEKPRRTGTIKTEKQTVRTAQETFKRIVCASQCLKRADPAHECEGPLQAAHVVPKRVLKRRNMDHLMWDPINGVPLCYRAHRRHDNGVDRIPRSWLPSRCVKWAETHGLTDALEREWPKGAGRKTVKTLTERFTGFCVLCGVEGGDPFKVNPYGSFTAGNLLCVCPDCVKRLERREPGPCARVIELAMDDSMYVLTHSVLEELYAPSVATIPQPPK